MQSMHERQICYNYQKYWMKIEYDIYIFFITLSINIICNDLL